MFASSFSEMFVSFLQTYVGDVTVAVNPYRNVNIYDKEVSLQNSFYYLRL